MKNILFIGLGRMGFPMAGHLAKNKDFTVSVYNRTAEKITRWVANPSAAAYTPSMTTADVQQVLNTLASQVAAIPSQLNRSDTLQAQAQQAVTRLHNLLDTAKATLNDSHLQQAFTQLLPSKTLAEFSQMAQAKGATSDAVWQAVVTEVSRYAGQDAVGCFVGGTLIRTESDIISIETIQLGDEVLSKPENGLGEVSYQPVIQTFIHADKPVWLVEAQKIVKLDDQHGNILDYKQYKSASREIKLLVTPNHPIWVVGTFKNGEVRFYDTPHWKRVDELARYEVAVNQHGVMYSIQRAQPVYRFKATADAEVNPDLYWYQKHYYEDYETDYLYGDVKPDFDVTEADYKAIGYVYDVSYYEEEGLKGVYLDECSNALKDTDGHYIPFTRDVYNLEVANNHTYYVGLSSMWVHNTSSPAQVLLQTARDIANGVNQLTTTQLDSLYSVAKQYWLGVGASTESEWNNCDFDKRQIQQMLFDD